jgi:autotransporter-associated beta strand protein
MEISASSFLFSATRWNLSKKFARRTILALAIGCGFSASPLLAATYTVTNGNNAGAGSLRQALTDANAAGAGPHTINVDNSVNNINVTADLPWVNTNVTIEGNTTSINGNNHRLFFVNTGTVNLRNMDLTGGRAVGGQGGDGAGGGGGGLGAGGGLFVNAGANVTIQGVTFDGNNATGGNGGGLNAILGGGGGGGLGGNGGSGGTDLLAIGAGGGGGGLFGHGGDGGVGGGGGGGSLSNGGIGGALLGGLGLNGAGNGGNLLDNGNDGAANGGGGGGGLASDGGDGGIFGGGGGAGLDLLVWGNGGDGGFGAGGGGSNLLGIAGNSGFGAGAGGAGTIGSGGSGYGGAVFVRQGGNLTIIDSSATANNGVTAGLGLNNGQTGGSNLYLMTGVNTTFSGSGTSQIAGGIDGAGGIIKQGTGTLILNGTNSYTGGTTVSGGTLQGTTDNLQGNITNNAIIDFNQATNGTYAGTMSGSGSLIKNGTGTVTLTGPNTYSGGTTINNGTLAGSSTSLQGDITNNAHLQFDQAGNGTYSGTISGSGNVIKNGNGTLTLTGPNTYSGGTTISGGTLQGNTTSLQGNVLNNSTLEINQANAGTFGGNITGTGNVVKSGNGTVTLNGTNNYTGGTTVSGGSLQGTTNSVQGNIANNANVELNQGFNGTYAGTMTGNGSLNKNGLGTVTLTGPNTYSGGTNVSGGTLQGTTTSLQGNITNNANVEFNQSTNGTYTGTMSGNGSLVKNGTGNITLSGPNTYSGGTTVNNGTLTGTTTSIQGNVANDATVQFDQASNGTYAGSISGSGNLIKNGTGTVILTGPNTYSGGTTISAGTLQGNTTSLQGNILNNSTLAINQANSGTLNGNISGIGNLVKSGTGTVTLNGTNNYTGGTTVSGGTLQGTTNSIQGNIANNANVEFNQANNGTYAGTMTGSGALIKNGTGTVTITGPNTYSGGTTVSGGTLQGTTTSLQGNIANNSNVEFNQTTNGTYAGTMSGSGSLVKNGTGNVTLSGPNSYTGGTTVNSGTLTGTTTSIQGNVLNNGIVQFNQATNGTYAGTISGNGAVIKSGAGTVTLNGNNLYTGGTAINAGTLQGTTDSLQGNVNNNGVLEFNQAGNGTFNGNISGAGSVLKNGAGTVVLNGTNAHQGGTTVNAGTLQGNTNSLQGNIANNANLRIDQSFDGTFNGTISGNGTLIKAGTGAVSLNTPQSYSGSTTVENGTLAVNSSLAGNVQVNPNGALAGVGTINGNLNNNGIVRPGQTGSIGTLSVNGNYIGTSTSGLNIRINNGGTIPGVNNDLLDVNGNVNLAGALNVNATSSNIAPGSRYRFLTFSGLRTGTFSTVNDNLPLLNSVVTYGTGFAELEMVRNSTTYASLARSQGQVSFARYLDEITQNPVGDLQTVVNELNMLDTAGLQAAYDHMASEITADVNEMGIQNTTQVYLTMNRQFRWHRNQNNRQASPSRQSYSQYSSASPVQLVNYEEEPEPVFSLPTTAFQPVTEGIITGYGMNGTVASDSEDSGGAYSIGGTLFSIQRHLAEDLTVGFFGAYSDISIVLTSPAQSGHVTDFQIGGNVRRAFGINYVLAAGSVGFDTYSTKRPIDFGGIHRTATGYTTGYQAAAWLERGWMLQLGPWDVQPFVAVQYIHIVQNGYNESGASSLDLQIHDVTTDALRPIVGIHAARPFMTRSCRAITPEVNAMFVHELLEPETSFNSVLAGSGGGSFITDGVDYGQTWAVIGGGLSYQINDCCTLFGNYDVQTNASQKFNIASMGLQFVW